MEQGHKAIGIFGGSFNPIHIGHLALANYLCEFASLDEVWFMVSPLNPLKPGGELLPDARRLELVKLAIDGYNRFRASDFEFHLPLPSYTVHTLRSLKTEYPEHDFRLIIGSDNWQVFHQWYDWESILAENKLIIYPRPGYEVQEEELPPNVQLVQAPLLDISSTFVRRSIQAGKDIRFFLPQAVYNKIEQEKWYQ